MLHLPIYLDYSATTPVDPRVVDRMVPYLREKVRQPRVAQPRLRLGGRAGGRKCARAGRDAGRGRPEGDRVDLGATESINLALKGAAHFYKERGRHLVTVKTEHKATLDTMRELEREGFEVTYLDVDSDGMIDQAAFERALRPDTIWLRSCT